MPPSIERTNRAPYSHKKYMRYWRAKQTGRLLLSTDGTVVGWKSGPQRRDVTLLRRPGILYGRR